jgi:hypothetical protein
MPFRRLLDAAVQLEFVIDMLAQKRGPGKNLEPSMAARPEALVSHSANKPFCSNSESHVKSQASHTVEVEPNPSFPTTWYRSLIISPIRVG